MNNSIKLPHSEAHQNIQRQINELTYRVRLSRTRMAIQAWSNERFLSSL